MTTHPDETAAVRDLVNRHFTATQPNQLWVSDFTYVSTADGFVYTAFAIDVFALRDSRADSRAAFRTRVG